MNYGQATQASLSYDMYVLRSTRSMHAYRNSYADGSPTIALIQTLFKEKERQNTKQAIGINSLTP